MASGMDIWRRLSYSDRRHYMRHYSPTLLVVPYRGVGPAKAVSFGPGDPGGGDPGTGGGGGVGNRPALPLTEPNITMPNTSGWTVVNLTAGMNLQTAIDNATRNTIIVLEAGATWTTPTNSSFFLPTKSGTGWIFIVSSNLASLPSNTRVSSATNTAKIIANGVAPAFDMPNSASHYRLAGLEITHAVGVSNNGLIQFGSLSNNSESLCPSFLYVDRCYVHGYATGPGCVRGILMNGKEGAVFDSTFDEFWKLGQECQAICGINGPGPWLFQNVWTRAAGENVLIGGGDPAIPNMVPRDLTFRKITMTKKLSWQQASFSDADLAASPTVKNIFELKNAERVLLEGFIAEYNWPHSQNGFSFLFTPRNQDGGAGWIRVRDATIRKGIMRYMHSGFNIAALDANHPGHPTTQRILVQDVLMHNIGSANVFGYADGGEMIRLLDGPDDVIFERVTLLTDASASRTWSIGAFDDDYGDPIKGPGFTRKLATGFFLKDSILKHNGSGWFGTATGAYMADAIGPNFYTTPVITPNGIIGAGGAYPGGGTYQTRYPSGNTFAANETAVMFNTNFSLQGPSPFKGQGTGGIDLGANRAAIDAAIPS